MKIRCCFMLIFINFGIFIGTEAQTTPNNETGKTKQFVTCDCGEKFLDDLIPKLELVKVSNENISLRLFKVETMLEKLEHTDHDQFIQSVEQHLTVALDKILKRRLKSISNQFMNALNKVEKTLNDRVNVLENKTLEKFNSALNSTAHNIREAMKHEIEIAVKAEHDQFIEPLKKKVDELLDFRRESNPNILQELAHKDKETLPELKSANSIGVSAEMICKNSTEVQNCAEALKGNQCPDGIYSLHIPELKAFNAYCKRDEKNKNSPAWTVVQRRQNRDVDFNRIWINYTTGFGDLENDFWLGLAQIHALTSTGNNELIISFEDLNGNKYFGKYSNFSVGDERSAYLLKSIGTMTGDANELLLKPDVKFSTREIDNDGVAESNFAAIMGGGWWYHGYQFAPTMRGWDRFLHKVEMAIRPREEEEKAMISGEPS